MGFLKPLVWEPEDRLEGEGEMGRFWMKMLNGQREREEPRLFKGTSEESVSPSIMDSERPRLK